MNVNNLHGGCARVWGVVAGGRAACGHSSSEAMACLEKEHAKYTKWLQMSRSDTSATGYAVSPAVKNALFRIFRVSVAPCGVNLPVVSSLSHR